MKNYLDFLTDLRQERIDKIVAAQELILTNFLESKGEKNIQTNMNTKRLKKLIQKYKIEILEEKSRNISVLIAGGEILFRINWNTMVATWNEKYLKGGSNV
jgi:hypothetical protein